MVPAGVRVATGRRPPRRLVRASMVLYRARVSPSLAFFGRAAAIGLAIQSCPVLFRRRSFAFASQTADWLISGTRCERAQIDQFATARNSTQ